MAGLVVEDGAGGVRRLPLRVKVADGFFSRLIGLMFRLGLADDEALWLADCRAIHMLFVPFAIDAVFVDDGGRVVKVARAAGWWGFAAAPAARHTLELPAGAAERLGLREGMRVRLDRET